MRSGQRVGPPQSEGGAAPRCALVETCSYLNPTTFKNELNSARRFTLGVTKSGRLATGSCEPALKVVRMSTRGSNIHAEVLQQDYRPQFGDKLLPCVPHP